MYKYFKHSYLTCWIVPAAALTVFLAPQWAFFIPVVITLLNAVGDIMTPPDRSVPEYSQHWILDAMVYLYVPFVSLYMFSVMWIAAPGDLLSLGRA